MPLTGSEYAEAIRALDGRYVMHTYSRQTPLFVRGAGTRLYDAEGKEYLDLVAGIAVCVLGHCHPRLVEAIARQAATLMHTSNLYLTAPMAKLAERLCSISGGEKVFFANSGTEANEAALKIARKHALATRGELAYEVVSLEGSFHGRTFGSLAMTAQPKYQKPFGPMVPGMRYVPRDSIESLSAAVNANTAAVIIEPIQGESGIHSVSPEFLLACRTLCDQVGAMLIFDEIQCGMGRTGKWFAHEWTGVRPDILTVAKGLGGGFPVGAAICRGDAANTLLVGEHGSTFAGNALASAAALEVLAIIEDEGLVANAGAVGEYLRDRLRKRAGVVLPIAEVRGAGLMIGVELEQPIARKLVPEAIIQGLIVNATSETTFRIVPSLLLTSTEADDGIGLLEAAARKLQAAS